MATLKARCHSENFRCPEYCYGNNDDIDYGRSGIKSHACDTSLSTIKQKDREFDGRNEPPITRELSDHIANKLMTNDDIQNEIRSFIAEKVKKIEYNYSHFMEECSQMLSGWLKQRKATIVALRQSEKTFRQIYRTTTGITFASSAMEIAVRAGLILQDIFFCKLDMRIPALVLPVVAGISITSSVLAVSYSRAKLDDIARGLREERRRQRDLDMLYRKGKWIDKAVQDLFPFGIDLSLISDSTLDSQSWRQQVCSTIILTNIRKDTKVLEDRDFLPTVKAFVQSSAVEIWLNRMKLRKLLDAMSSKSEKVSEKEVTSDNLQVFLTGAAINLYPVFFPLFLKTENTDTLRFVFSSVAAIKTAMDLADSGAGKFQEMRDAALELKEDYLKVKKLNTDLVSDYD